MHDHFRPHRLAHRLEEVDIADLLARGVRGVILDLDNTLTQWKSTAVSPAVAAWVARLRAAGVQACVVSNAAGARRVRVVADALGIPWITRAGKPLARGFRKAMARMGTAPDATAAIGDQVFTDVWGGNRLGLYTILLDPTSSRESWFTKLVQRNLERAVGRVAKDDAAPTVGAG
jgi:HAD superfamily phosphatase (TIGR01668 family)